MKNTVIRYGVSSAATICILFLLTWFLGKGLAYGTQEIIGYASMIIALVFVYLGIKDDRDQENQGLVSFGRALSIGILISLIAALAFGVLDMIYIKYINPDFTTEYYAHYVEEMKASLPAAEFETKLKELEAEKEMFSNPIFSFLIMSVTVLMIGCIISLISALLLQKKSIS